MVADPLAEARVLAASDRLSGSAEYLRALLRVALAIHDRMQPTAPPAKGARK